MVSLLEQCAEALKIVSGLPVTTERGILWIAGHSFQPTSSFEGADADQIMLLPYVSPQLRLELQRSGRSYVDAAGNAWIVRNPLVVSIQGRKREDLSASKKRRPKLLSGGLQVVFILLTNPMAMSLPYREIAEQAGVALGTVFNTLTLLKEQGYLISNGKGGWLLDKMTLLGRWEQGYMEILRPKLFIGSYRPAGGSSVQACLERAKGLPEVLIGGEFAAAKLTGLLSPERGTVHIHGPQESILRGLRLLPDKNGAIDIFHRFGKGDAGLLYEGWLLLHPILVRAELLASKNGRLQEVAADLLT
jgi:hypothetical protein